MPSVSGPLRWIVAGVAIVLAVADFVRIDSGSHSVSDTLINWVPQAALILVVAIAFGAVTERLSRGRR
jgi:hypothetical protein